MFVRKQKYREVGQIDLEVQSISYLVKFWLDNIKNYTAKHLKTINFKTQDILDDFLSLYEVNRVTFRRSDNNQIVIRDKHIILHTLKNFRWKVSCSDRNAMTNTFITGPTELGMSILGMFGVAPFRGLIDPDIIMAICYYCYP